jgi:hypothetical protein
MDGWKEEEREGWKGYKNSEKVMAKSGTISSLFRNIMWWKTRGKTFQTSLKRDFLWDAHWRNGKFSLQSSIFSQLQTYMRFLLEDIVRSSSIREEEVFWIFLL